MNFRCMRSRKKTCFVVIPWVISLFWHIIHVKIILLFIYFDKNRVHDLLVAVETSLEDQVHLLETLLEAARTKQSSQSDSKKDGGGKSKSGGGKSSDDSAEKRLTQRVNSLIRRIGEKNIQLDKTRSQVESAKKNM